MKITDVPIPKIQERTLERVVERIIDLPVPQFPENTAEVPPERMQQVIVEQIGDILVSKLMERDGYHGEDELIRKKIAIEDGVEHHRPSMLNSTDEEKLDGKFEAGEEDQPTENDDEANKAKIGATSAQALLLVVGPLHVHLAIHQGCSSSCLMFARGGSCSVALHLLGP